MCVYPWNYVQHRSCQCHACRSDEWYVDFRCVNSGKYVPLRAADAWFLGGKESHIFQGFRVHLYGTPAFKEQFAALLLHAGDALSSLMASVSLCPALGTIKNAKKSVRQTIPFPVAD